MSSPVRVEREEGLAVLTLDSPPLNLFDQAMIDGVEAAIEAVGLTPSMGGTQRLAERAGSGRARQLVMTGELFSAEELERWGAVNLIFDGEDFDAQARAFAAELATGPTKAHAMTKHILARFREGGVPAADEAVRRDAGDLFATEDLQGAVRTFLERGGSGHATFEGR